jgi:hypothetical protein
MSDRQPLDLAALRREAEGIIQGRRDFEAHHRGGKESTKPLPAMRLDPRAVVELLDALEAAGKDQPAQEERERAEFHQGWKAGEAAAHASHEAAAEELKAALSTAPYIKPYEQP